MIEPIITLFFFWTQFVQSFLIRHENGTLYRYWGDIPESEYFTVCNMAFYDLQKMCNVISDDGIIRFTYWYLDGTNKTDVFKQGSTAIQMYNALNRAFESCTEYNETFPYSHITLQPESCTIYPYKYPVKDRKGRTVERKDIICFQVDFKEIPYKYPKD